MADNPAHNAESVPPAPTPRTFTEWGVRFGDGSVDECDSELQAAAAITFFREEIASGEYEADDYEPMTLMQRQVTVYKRHDGPWEPVRRGDA